MEKFKSDVELKVFRETCKENLDSQKKKVLVCAGTGCLAGGSDKIYHRIIELCQAKGIDVQVSLESHVDHIMLRSINAPGSPSSPLQTMYFCCCFCLATCAHLRPVG